MVIRSGKPVSRVCGMVKSDELHKLTRILKLTVYSKFS